MISSNFNMMTSSNGNIFGVTGPLCGEFTGPGEFPTQRPVTRSFDVFFDLRLNKRLSKQPWGWWFETLSWSLWRQCNVRLMTLDITTKPVYIHSAEKHQRTQFDNIKSMFIMLAAITITCSKNINENTVSERWFNQLVFKWCQQINDHLKAHKMKSNISVPDFILKHNNYELNHQCLLPPAI